jgi:hypothetical protein
MTTTSKPNAEDDKTLGPELQRHIADPGEKTEEATGEQDRAKKLTDTPVERDSSTEQQPS